MAKKSWFKRKRKHLHLGVAGVVAASAALVVFFVSQALPPGIPPPLPGPCMKQPTCNGQPANLWVDDLWNQICTSPSTPSGPYGGENPIIDTAGDDVIVGSSSGLVNFPLDPYFLNDVIGLVNGGNDTVCALDGDDAIISEADPAGDSWVDAGDGNDLIMFSYDGTNTIYGGNGSDEIIGGTGIDFIYGGYGFDEIDGRSGQDVITGEAGNDEIFGGPDNDLISGGPGADFINGGEGDDGIRGDMAPGTPCPFICNDTIQGGPGDDTIQGGPHNDIIRGGDENDTMWGGLGDDTICGDGENDTLYGGYGDDSIQADGGIDTVDGGPGSSDICLGSELNSNCEDFNTTIPLCQVIDTTIHALAKKERWKYCVLKDENGKILRNIRVRWWDECPDEEINKQKGGSGNAASLGGLLEEEGATEQPDIIPIQEILNLAE